MTQAMLQAKERLEQFVAQLVNRPLASIEAKRLERLETEIISATRSEPPESLPF